MEEHEIAEWCKETNLPNYLCVNEIKEMNIDDFINKYKIKQFHSTNYEKKEGIIEEYKDSYYNLQFEVKHIDTSFGKKLANYIQERHISSYISAVNVRTQEVCKKPIRILDYINNKTHIFHFDIEKYTLQKSGTNIKKTPYFVEGDKVKYSVLKEEYNGKNTHGYINADVDDFIEDVEGLPDKYYWKTPDGWLYLYDKAKPEIYSLDIVAPSPITPVTQTNISSDTLINNDLLLFTNLCCKKTNKPNLRFGLKDIYEIYDTWSKINGKKRLKTQKKFKEEFEKFNYKEEKSKGVDINNNPGKRGYNIMVSL
jgi:hypothetical protein